ncbi:MAG: hypothetical protein IPF87_04715 [Gemmatimonadetes bacterium]|nr:hypothetical protein [Gemmatimonadota bacterium]MBK7835239.1 hypothetical protein [Gemmatimonadota bacterium]
MATVEIHIRTNAETVARHLSERAQRQIPFALALANTKTARAGQSAMQERMPRIFQLRGSERLFRQAVKSKPATKRDLIANVRIEGPETAKGYDARVSRLILRHEKGGARTSDAVYRVHGQLQALGFFLPAKGLRTPAVNVPRRLYPSNIGAALRRNVDGSSYFANSRKGRKVKRGNAQREFSYVALPSGIYERRRFGSFSALRPLWHFERTIQLRPRLGFFTTLEAVVRTQHAANVQEALTFAFRTAR